MEVPTQVYTWLSRMNILQDAYVAKKKKQSVVLTQQAANAVAGGHVFYYICYNLFSSASIPVTVSLTGSPGEEIAPQAAYYNWSVLCDMFGQLGVQLSGDHVQLLVRGDTALLQDLLVDVYNRYSGEPKIVGGPQQKGRGGRRARSSLLAPMDPREGATSMDAGLDRMRRKASSSMSTYGKFSPEVDLMRAKERFERRQQKETEREHERRLAEVRADELRQRMTAAFHGTVQRQWIDLYPDPIYLPALREFANRGAVQLCNSIVMEIVDRVETGEAQEELRERERARQNARRAAEARKLAANRLVDVTCTVHLPRHANHAVAMMVKSIVLENIVEFALSDDVHKELEKREAARQHDRQVLSHMMSRLAQHSEKKNLKANVKFEERERLRIENERKQHEEYDRRIALMHTHNVERAKIERLKYEQLRKETALKQQMEAEKRKRTEAELALYYAEQKAKVLELQRQRQAQKDRELAAKQEDECRFREERRLRGQELNRKLQEREEKRLREMGRSSSAPPSLTPFNFGTGEHAAYFGDSLGWQYLTESEFDIAQMLAKVRTNPAMAVQWMQNRLDNTRNSVLTYVDKNGCKQPMPLCEGGKAEQDALEFLAKQKSVKPPDDISIGLTLASRQHAVDLAYHGIADATRHAGTDGSTVTQRLLKYGAPALRPGYNEIIFAVVRSNNLAFKPEDLLATIIADDGFQNRDNRRALFDPTLAESVGVGNAIATFKKWVVDVVVIIMSYSFIDKPVAWMSQAHHSGISNVAAPYINGDREVHQSIDSKRTLLCATNRYVGRTALPADFEKLSAEKLRKRQYQAPIVDPSSDDNEPPWSTFLTSPANTKSSGPSKRRDRSRSPEDEAPADEEKEAHTPKPKKKPHQAPTADAAALDPQERREAYRQRLTRFYTKYAPHKLSIVEAALTMYEGREEEMFFTLIRKYGPEPLQDEPLTRTKPQSPRPEQPAPSDGAEPVKEVDDLWPPPESKKLKPLKSDKSAAKKKPTSENSIPAQPEGQPEESAAPQEHATNEQPQSSQKNQPSENRKEVLPSHKQEPKPRKDAVSPAKGPEPMSKGKTKEEVPAVEPTPQRKTETESTASKVGRSGTDAEHKEKAPQSKSVESTAPSAAKERDDAKATSKDAPQQELEAVNSPAPSSKSNKPDVEANESQKNDTPSKEPPPAKTNEPPAKGSGETENRSASHEPAETDKQQEESEVKSNDQQAQKHPEDESAKGTEETATPSKRRSPAVVIVSERENVQPQRSDSIPNSTEASQSQDVSQNDGETDLKRTQSDAAYLDRARRFYGKYNPSRVPQCEKLIGAYKGREEAMFSALVKKYGPEPEE